MRTGSKGVTLLEALVTLFLIGICFAGVALIFKQGIAVYNRAQVGDVTVEGFLVLSQIGEDLRGALEVESPVALSTSDEIKFKKLNRDANILQNVESGTFWNPSKPELLMDYHYFLDGEDLVLTKTPHSSPSHRVKLLSQVNALSIQQTQDSVYELRLSFQRDKVLVTRRLLVRTLPL